MKKRGVSDSWEMWLEEVAPSSLYAGAGAAASAAAASAASDASQKPPF